MACLKNAYLSDRAIARGYCHPGIVKYRHMVSTMPAAPHAGNFNAAVRELCLIDLKDDGEVREWKEEVEPLFEKLEICEQKLREIVDEKDVKAFVDVEGKVMAKETEDSGENKRNSWQRAD